MVPAEEGDEKSLVCRSRHCRRASASWGFVGFDPTGTRSLVSQSRTRSSLRRRIRVLTVAMVKSTREI